MPVRMCIACRNMFEKDLLLRIVRIKGEEPKIDKTYKAQGRGAYVCKNAECVKLAKRKKAFERAFSAKSEQLYDEIMGEINQI